MELGRLALHNSSDPRSHLIEHGPLRQLVILRTEVHPKAISLETRNHMQMNMKDLLPGCFSICQEEVHPITPYARSSHRTCQLRCYPKEVTPDFCVQLCKVGCMRPRHNQKMARIDGLNVHECHCLIISIDDTCWGSLPDDLTEHAGR